MDSAGARGRIMWIACQKCNWPVTLRFKIAVLLASTDLARQLLSELSERAGQFYPFVVTGAGALPFPIGALPIQPASPAERATQHSTHISFFISNLLKDFD